MQAASVTELTNALEGITDTKHFTGDLVNNLHAAEKHIRKNKLKVLQRRFCTVDIRVKLVSHLQQLKEHGHTKAERNQFNADKKGITD